jgi:hypothetical protein
MVTVGRIGRLRVVIYPNDHRPAHVHVIGKGCEAVFKLNCPQCPPALRENYGFPASEIARIKTALEDKTALICTEWRIIHGLP